VKYHQPPKGGHEFYGCTRRLLSEAGAQCMLALVDDLDALPDVREIMDIARGGEKTS
jgi:hypothetical protein